MATDAIDEIKKDDVIETNDESFVEESEIGNEESHVEVDEVNNEVIVSDEDISVIDDNSSNDIWAEKIIPYSINHKVINQQDIANLTYISKDNNHNMFTISRCFYIKDEDTKDFIESLPFIENDEMFIGTKLARKEIVDTLPNYIFEGKFGITKSNMNSNKPEFIMYTKNSKTNLDHSIYISSNHFVSLAFIDSYITDMITNNHDLDLAANDLAMITSTYAEIFNVDKIDKIVSIGEMGGKKTRKNSLYGVQFKATRNYVPNSEEENESAYILAILDLGITVNKKKLKNIDKIKDSYFTDANQYISRLFIDNIHLDNIDSDYMIISTINKNNESRLFFFNNEIKDELIDLLKEF